MQKFSPVGDLADLKQKKYSALLYLSWAAFTIFCLVGPMFLGRFYVSFLLLIFIYCILSIGFNIAAGFCGVTTFATGAIYGAGAYTAAILYTTLGVPFTLAALLGALAGGIMSLFVTLAAYKVHGIYLALVSFGLIEVTTLTLSQSAFTGGAGGFRLDRWIFFGMPVTLNAVYYITFAFSI